MLLARLLSKIYKKKGIILIDSQGQKYICGKPDLKNPLTLILQKKDLNWKLVINPDLNFPEAYMRGEIKIENGSLLDFLNVTFENIVCGISASGPTKRWDINNYIRLFEELNKKYKINFFIAGGVKDEGLIKKVMNSQIGKNCVSFSKMKISETMSIIGASQYYIGNDTGWGHIASGLGLKSLFLFMDSPPLAYGVYSKNINIICPDNLTIENTGHNTRGKDQISFDNVLIKSIELIN